MGLCNFSQEKCNESNKVLHPINAYRRIRSSHSGSLFQSWKGQVIMQPGIREYINADYDTESGIIIMGALITWVV